MLEAIFVISTNVPCGYRSVRSLDAVHGVVDHREVLARQQGLDGVEVEDGLEQCNVRLRWGHLL